MDSNIGVAEFKVVDIDWAEKDASLIIAGETFYFQFSRYPSIQEAMAYIKRALKEVGT